MNSIANIQIIGRIRSCYSEKWGTPRQGRYCSISTANIEFNSEIFSKKELLEFKGYSHVIIIFIFHLNNIRKNLKINCKYPFSDGQPEINFLYSNNNAKITPPKITRQEKRGCLATRSPHRPVPVGLSICSLKSISIYEMKMTIGGVDIIDKTPIIEVIPYMPFYSVSFDFLRFPNWVSSGIDGFENELKIYFSLASFFDIINFCFREKKLENGNLREQRLNQKSAVKLFQFIVQLLRIDPRSRYSKSKTDHKLFGMKLFENFQLVYFHHENFVQVIRFITSEHLIVKGLNPRTSDWFIRIKKFTSLTFK